MAAKSAFGDQFDWLGENKVTHRPTEAKFWAYPGRPELAGHNPGNAGCVLPSGDEYELEEIKRAAEDFLENRPLG